MISEINIRLLKETSLIIWKHLKDIRRMTDTKFITTLLKLQPSVYQPKQEPNVQYRRIHWQLENKEIKWKKYPYIVKYQGAES